MHQNICVTMESNRRVEIFGESSYTYDMWTKKLKKVTANTVGRTYGTMLLQFKGCSDSRTETIMEKFPTPKALYNHLKTMQTRKHAVDSLKDLRGGNQLKSIGPVLSGYICDVWKVD
jgi:hypothetical protein